MRACYPLRVGTSRNSGNPHPVVHQEEVTIAELLKGAGYTSAAFGKWDLAGHSQTKYQPELLPTRQGSDYFFGAPTSNDSIVHLLRNDKVVEKNAKMEGLMRRFTDEAIGFIRRSKDRPFFVYLAQSMPHIKLAVSPQFRGKPEGGI